MRGELGRREVLGLGAALVARAPRAEAEQGDGGRAEEAFDAIELELDGAAELARRARVVFPRVEKEAQLQPLVLLHGLAETKDISDGVHAWADRYGLLTSYARLAHPPVTIDGARGDLPGERARAINDELGARPFRGKMAFVCPYTPNIWRLRDAKGGLARYADWIVDVLLPAVHARLPATEGPAAIDGCSLGGFIGLEVFLRRPAAFAAWGGVQSAIGQGAASATADRIAGAIRAAGARPLHIETSRRDPFYAANVALSLALEKRNVRHDLTVLPGPHDQPWLREAGTLEMLLWHDRLAGYAR
jgi:hypothetical protein